MIYAIGVTLLAVGAIVLGLTNRWRPATTDTVPAGLRPFDHGLTVE
ncbi:MAG: hypothetical protein HY246_09530 [Proteobacteria bacterium]|nr:hypothetical protein [Pseudomonadota bacterium]